MTLEEDWGKSFLFCSGWRWMRGAEWPALTTIVLPTQNARPPPLPLPLTPPPHTQHTPWASSDPNLTPPLPRLQLVYFGLVTRRHSGHMWRSIKLKIHMELNFFDATKKPIKSLLISSFKTTHSFHLILRRVYPSWECYYFIICKVFSYYCCLKHSLCSVTHHRFQQSQNERGTKQLQLQLGAWGGKLSSFSEFTVSPS